MLNRIREKLEAARNLKAVSRKQADYINALIDKALINIYKELELMVDGFDFDEFFACWYGFEEEEKDCWTGEKAYKFLEEKLKDIN